MMILDKIIKANRLALKIFKSLIERLRIACRGVEVLKVFKSFKSKLYKLYKFLLAHKLDKCLQL